MRPVSFLLIGGSGELLGMKHIVGRGLAPAKKQHTADIDNTL